MYSLFPIYTFEFETGLSQSQIANNLRNLLKKEEKSKKKFEIRIQGTDWGIEEFQGTIEDGYFKLKRYRYFSKDIKCFVYNGKVKPLTNGCLIQCIFRFDLTTILIFSLFFMVAAVQIIAGIKSNNFDNVFELFGIALLTILLYLAYIIAFNYRVGKVKELIEKKLRKRA